jgi:tRNA(Ile2)-agmatinylcytidine synthase
VTVVALDDTDSRERGMCTTYLAARVADALAAEGPIERTLLLRCNPAVEHKTRGNAAVAVHAAVDPAVAFDRAAGLVERLAVAGGRTQPGLVVAPGDPADPATVPDPVVAVARDAVRGHLGRDRVRAVAGAAGYRTRGWAGGRGLIGALAAVGAWRAFAGWTYERIVYRTPDRRGGPRAVDAGSLRSAADAAGPVVWDTVDRAAGEAVAVPATPGPVLFGIRGDEPGAVARVADRVAAEPAERAHTFVTNQGTDAHLRDAPMAAVRDGRSYRVDGRVVAAPETRAGGHVFLTLADGPDDRRLPCVAFEPTKRFRDRVRALRPGDRLTVCGEVGDGTLKLEKFAVRALDRTERVTPTCPGCDRRMSSAGRDAGYRCRDCGTSAPGRVERRVERDLERGWYEVPPRARRHVATPLVRGGFDAPVHPER